MNRTSKKHIFNLIQRAMQAGFKRKVEVVCDSASSRCVMVILSAYASRGGLANWANVYVVFKRRAATKHWAISMSSRCDFETEVKHGRRNANYALKYYIETKRRHDELFADASLKSANL